MDEEPLLQLPGGPPSEAEALAAKARADALLRAPTPAQEEAQRQWAEALRNAAERGASSPRHDRVVAGIRMEESEREQARLHAEAGDEEQARAALCRLAWGLHYQGRHREAYEACPVQFKGDREFFLAQAVALERDDGDECSCPEVVEVAVTTKGTRGKTRMSKWELAGQLPSPLHNRHVFLWRCRVCGDTNYRPTDQIPAVSQEV